MTQGELEAMVRRLEERVGELERCRTADAWPPRPHFGYVPRGTLANAEPPFHDPVLE